MGLGLSPEPWLLRAVYTLGDAHVCEILSPVWHCGHRIFPKINLRPWASHLVPKHPQAHGDPKLLLAPMHSTSGCCPKVTVTSRARSTP